ncbi:MAG: anaerobic ribonucleoside-triphosphate reductase activating protein [bacterium]
MKIGGLERFSLIDYPGQVAAIIFTQGCTFRCGFCYNPELVNPSLFTPTIPEEEVLTFLKEREGKLGALVITGGEPTMQEDLPEFIARVRALGMLVKLDTNGSNPEMLEQLLKDKLVQYVAMDIKAPLDKYADATCVAIEPERIKRSIGLIMKSGVDYEFRTTVVRSQLGSEDFKKIGELIKGAKLYALQKFVIPPIYKINNVSFLKEKTYTTEEFEEIRKQMEPHVQSCILR